jgi:hypothetical protein
MVLTNNVYNVTSRYRFSEHSLWLFYKRKEYYIGLGYATIFNVEDYNTRTNKITLNGISCNFGVDIFRTKNNKLVIPVSFFFNYYQHNYLYGVNGTAKLVFSTRGIKVGVEYKPLKQNIFIYTYGGIANVYRYDRYIEPTGEVHAFGSSGFTTVLDIGLKYYFGKPFGK